MPNATGGGLWNQIAQEISIAQGNSLVQNARLFALLDLTLADTAIACWDAKYTYNFWRPVTAIRAADTDGNPDTEADPTWSPLMNTSSHPSYPSAHATELGGCAAELTAFFGTDTIPFRIAWEGLPGVTRSFAGFTAAAEELEQSRIWAGFHWSFDLSAGDALGKSVAAYTFQNFLLPSGGAARPPSAASVHVVIPTLTTVEASSIKRGGPTVIGGENSPLPDTSGAGLTGGRPTVVPLLAVANRYPALVAMRATEPFRSEAAGPPMCASSVDDVFASDGPWEVHGDPLAQGTERS
jgi:hypothetical protein